MDYTGITFGLDVLVSVVFGAGGALAVWFKMKGKQDIMQVELDNFRMQAASEISNLKKEGTELKTELKEKDVIIHKRVGDLKDIVEENRKGSDKGYNDIRSEMQAMELRIITAIHDINKK